MKERITPSNIYIASGSAHPELAQNVADYLNIEVGDIETKRFPSGERYVRYNENIRGKHVFAIQSHITTPEIDINSAIWEHGMLVDAARRSSASEITAISPHMGYMRQERQARGREAIGTTMIMNFLDGADRFVAVDLHSPQVTGITTKPFEPLTAQIALEQAMLPDLDQYDKQECVVVAPDAGASKLAQSHQRRMDLDILHLAKKRGRGDSSKITRDELVPEAADRVCVVFDDMIDTAGTLVTATEALKKSGAKAIYVAATHGIFSNDAVDKLKSAPIDRLYVTDTFPQQRAKEALGDRLQVVSVAPIIGQAILEIATNGSVSDLFDDDNHL